MSRNDPKSLISRGLSPGFSLVEVTIAIGIFAFVMVAILGLFPVALRQRTDAALETRAVLVAQQVFQSILSSTNTSQIFLPPLFLMGEEDPNLRNKALNSFPVTMHYGRTGTAALGIFDGESGWSSGVTETDADAVSRVRIDPVGSAAPGLYRATVDYGRPANLPEAKRRNFSFSKLVYLP